MLSNIKGFSVNAKNITLEHLLSESFKKMCRERKKEIANREIEIRRGLYCVFGDSDPLRTLSYRYNSII